MVSKVFRRKELWYSESYQKGASMFRQFFEFLGALSMFLWNIIAFIILLIVLLIIAIVL